MDDVKITMMDVDELIPYANNPRVNDGAVKYVAASIRDFGFKVPIVVDRDGVIVAGHTRFKAAKELGLHRVPCIIADDLTDEQVRAFRLADNKTAEKSTWDFGALGEELDGLMDLFDMSDFGFDDADPLAGANALDLDDESARQDSADKTQCHCPKCGFVFEV